MVWRDPFKGMSTQEISNIDLETLNSWDRRTIARAVRRLSDTANKRLKSFEKKGIESPAYLNVVRSGGKFNTRGKTINQLRSEFIRVRNFLRMKTSTQKGYERVKQDFFTRVGATKLERMTLDDDLLNKFWHVVSEIEPDIAKFIKGSGEQQKYVYDIFIQNSDLTEDALKKKVSEELDFFYKATQERELSGMDFFSVMA